MTNDSTGWTDVLFGLTAAQLEGIRGYIETVRGIGVTRELDEEIAGDATAAIVLGPRRDRNREALAKLVGDGSAYGRGAQAAMRLTNYTVKP